MKQIECQLCSSDNPEVKVILAYLRTRIIKQSHVYEPDYHETEPNKDPNHDGFSRLLALMFGHRLTIRQPSFVHCVHPKFSRYFRRKLKCDNNTFHSLCSEIASKIAEKNYQLQALNTQIISVTSTAQKEASNPLTQEVAQNVLEGKERREERKRQASTTTVIPGSQNMERRPEMMFNMGMSRPLPPLPPLMHFPRMFQGPHESN